MEATDICLWNVQSFNCPLFFSVILGIFAQQAEFDIVVQITVIKSFVFNWNIVQGRFLMKLKLDRVREHAEVPRFNDRKEVLLVDWFLTQNTPDLDVACMFLTIVRREDGIHIDGKSVVKSYHFGRESGN